MATTSASVSASAKYICCRCIGEEEPFMNMIYCRVCNLSAVCKNCFAFMERAYEAKEIICPVCCHVYYGELRNSIVKYALEYSIGMDKMSEPLINLWKRNVSLSIHKK